MFFKNQEELFSRIKEGDFVVDIGGGAQPLRRANMVIDVLPYEKRGSGGAIGNAPERFTKDGWITRDLCEKTPFPLKDKDADFVFCSHTLEDLRDPIWVCSEIVRIGKRGYIEVPSRIAEICRGVESHAYPGYYQHRWLVEYKDNELVFLLKSPVLNLSKNYINILPDEPMIGFFWEGSFRFKEDVITNIADLIRNYESFSQQQRKRMPALQRIENDILYHAPSMLRAKMLFKEWKRKRG